MEQSRQAFKNFILFQKMFSISNESFAKIFAFRKQKQTDHWQCINIAAPPFDQFEQQKQFAITLCARLRWCFVVLSWEQWQIKEERAAITFNPPTHRVANCNLPFSHPTAGPCADIFVDAAWWEFFQPFSHKNHQKFHFTSLLVYWMRKDSFIKPFDIQIMRGRRWMCGIIEELAIVVNESSFRLSFIS